MLKIRMLVALLCLVLATLAHAHKLDLCFANFLLQDKKVSCTLILPYNTLNLADDNQDKTIDQAEIKKHIADYHNLFKDQIVLRDGNTVAKLTVIPPPDQFTIPNITGDPKSHAGLVLLFEFPTKPTDFKIHYGFFPPQINDRCLATIIDNGTESQFIFQRGFEDYRAEPLWKRFKGFCGMGLHHLLTGIDHMLFLMALICVSDSFWNLFKTVTAFTVGHSLSLLLAVFNVVSVSTSIVEPIIALSIIYAAVENLYGKSFEGRWKIAFAFGLIHGLGFADAMTSLSLSGASLAVALVGFNVGVELGQMIIVTIAYPILRKIAVSNYGTKILNGGSIAVSLVATYWFFERVSAAIH
jgi:hypothetical protein